MKGMIKSEGTPTARALRLLFATVIAAGTTFVALHFWFGLGGNGLDQASEIVYDAVILAAGLTCLVRSRSAGAEGLAWIFVGASLLAWGAAEIYWTAEIVGNPSAPYPSPADIGYLAFYPLAGIGLALLVRARADEVEWRLWMDGAIAALATAALGTAFVFDFVADQTSGTSTEIATTLAYPLGDIVLFSFVVGIVALTRWRPGRSWTLLLVGMATMAFADTAYTLQFTDLGVPEGNWIEPIYLIAAACLGAQAWQRRTDAITSAEDETWRELMVPAISFAAMTGLVAMQYTKATSSLATALWAATMITVILRLAMSVRENKKLLTQVRTDPLTGLGSRGALQVDLEARCARASAEDPISLLLFDLNGFKRYNDSFGHPAGDELLAEFGVELRRVLGPDGAGYRVGGDEFCVILTCPASEVDEVIRRTASAFTATRNGVRISAAWGSASVPGDADSPGEAMQLADLRMYAQKESRRASRDSTPVSTPLPEAQLGETPSVGA
jgi:diguanylate cyclase (GGDEF)-like protein